MNKDGMLRVAAGHRHYDHRLAPFCAIENGYFDEEGVGPVLVQATGNDDKTVDALLTGEIDIALDVSPAKILQARETGGQLVIVAAAQNGIRQVLTGVKSLNSVEDLRGKRIHVVERGTGIDWHPLRILLRQRGIDPDRDVTVVPGAPFPVWRNAQHAFENDIADARMLLLAEAANIRAAGYPVLFDFSAQYSNTYPQRVVVVTPDFVTSRAALLQAFLRALIRGYRYIADGANYEAAMRVAHKYVTDDNLGFPPGYPIEFHKGYGFIRPADGGFSMADLQRYIAEEAMEGRISAGMKADDIADLRYVAAAAHEVDARTSPATQAIPAA